MAMSAEQVVAGLDEAHAVLVQAQAVFLRYLRQADLLRCASKESASSTAVWLRNRHRGSVRSVHRLVRLAKRLDAAPAVVGEAVALLLQMSRNKVAPTPGPRRGK